MPLYGIDGNRHLRLIAEQPMRLETDIHSLVEANLEAIFGLKLVAHEFTVGAFTLDTVAFDDETSGFVIIEYKRDEGGSVIDQGYAYLGTMLNNRAEFVLKYNEVMDKKLTKDQVDWSQSRILFVTQRFTPYQVAAINFKDLPIELWRFNKYENGTLLLEQMKPTGATASIKPLMQNKAAKAVQSAVDVQTAEDFRHGLPPSLQAIYGELESAIRENFPDVVFKIGKGRLILKRQSATICYVNGQQGAVRLLLRLPDIPSGNSLGTMRGVKEGDVFRVQAHLKSPKDVTPAVTLIKSAYHETGRVLGESA